MSPPDATGTAVIIVCAFAAITGCVWGVLDYLNKRDRRRQRYEHMGKDDQ